MTQTRIQISGAFHVTCTIEPRYAGQLSLPSSWTYRGKNVATDTPFMFTSRAPVVLRKDKGKEEQLVWLPEEAISPQYDENDSLLVPVIDRASLDPDQESLLRFLSYETTRVITTNSNRERRTWLRRLLTDEQLRMAIARYVFHGIAESKVTQPKYLVPMLDFRYSKRTIQADLTDVRRQLETEAALATTQADTPDSEALTKAEQDSADPSYGSEPRRLYDRLRAKEPSLPDFDTAMERLAKCQRSNNDERLDQIIANRLKTRQKEIEDEPEQFLPDFLRFLKSRGVID